MKNNFQNSSTGMKKFLLTLFVFTVVFGFGSFFVVPTQGVFNFSSNSPARAATWGPGGPGYYDNVTVSPATTVAAGTTLTVSGNIYGSVTLETDCPINPTTHAQGVAILEDQVISAFYRLDAGASTDFGYTQIQRGQGSYGCIYPSSPQPTIKPFIYSFSVNIGTTGMAAGPHSVVFSGATSSSGGNDVIGPYTVNFTISYPTPVLSADSLSVYTDAATKDIFHVTNGSPGKQVVLTYIPPSQSGMSNGTDTSMPNTDSSGNSNYAYGTWNNSSAGIWQFYVTVDGQKSNTISVTFKPITSFVPNPLNFIFSGDQVISFKKGGQQITAPEWVSNSPPVAVPNYAVNLGAKISNMKCNVITLDGNQWLFDSQVNCNTALGGVTLLAGDSKNFNVQITDPPYLSSQNLPPNTYNGYITITANGDFAFLEKNFPRGKGWAIIRGANAASSTATKTISVQYQVPFPAPACSASPNPVIAGQSTTLSATGGDGANYSWNTGGGSPASGSGASLSVSYATAGTKTVSVTSSGQSGTCSVVVTAPTPTPIPSADIKANGSDGPISIAYNTSVTLSWTSTNATSCSVTPGGWTGTSNPGVSTGNLTSSTTYNLNCSGPGGSATDNVIVNVNPPINNPPTVSAVTYTEPNYCTSGPDVSIRWTYADIDGDAQASYQVQVAANGSAWSVITADSGVISSSNNAWSVGPGSLLFNTTYKARVRVTDARGATSSWVETSLPSNTWKTPLHAYPWIPFPLSYTPSSPRKNLPTQFTDSSTCYDNNNNPIACASWLWNFGDTGTSNLQSPSHTYSSIGSFNSTQTVTDKSGNTCTSSPPTVINILQPNPQWKEVSPK